jgi:hypothetical protein
MKVRINKTGTKATLKVSTYEGFQIWLGLKELAKGYEESIQKYKDDQVETINEDLMFLHTELGRVYTLMYQMTEDFDPAHKRQAQAFFEDCFPEDLNGNPSF